MGILIYIILISFSLFLLFKYNERIEDTLPYVFISIIIFLFFMGLIRLLKIGIYLISIVGIILFICCVFKFIKIKNKKDIYKKLGNDKYSIYYVSQASYGLDYWIFKYTNRRNINNINIDSWSLGDKYNDVDIWTSNISAVEWLDELINNYDYVYLFSVDKKFVDRYGILFNNCDSICDKCLYKVDKVNKNLVK